jgi:hypothetical protein
MNRHEAHQLGKAIDSYMRFRAEQENRAYEFTPELFEEAILDGCVMFFGITFANGKLVGDEQQPTLFERWNRKH